jgi:hypothetical protein
LSLSSGFWLDLDLELELGRELKLVLELGIELALEQAAVRSGPWSEQSSVWSLNRNLSAKKFCGVD